MPAPEPLCYQQRGPEFSNTDVGPAVRTSCLAESTFVSYKALGPARSSRLLCQQRHRIGGTKGNEHIMGFNWSSDLVPALELAVPSQTDEKDSMVGGPDLAEARTYKG